MQESQTVQGHPTGSFTQRVMKNCRAPRLRSIVPIAWIAE
jgi:hypothetical protein